MRLGVTTPAAEELEGILTYLASESPRAASALSGAIDDMISHLKRMPELGRPTARKPIRRIVVPGFPYIIYYQISGDMIKVLAFFHAARQPKPEMFGR